MNILVTGAKGQLGTEIRKCFENGYTELGVPEILKQENNVRYIDIDELDISNLCDLDYKGRAKYILSELLDDFTDEEIPSFIYNL